MKHLILASQSPRRSEILKNAGYFFVSLPVEVSEIPQINLSLNEQIIDIARRKAIQALNLIKDPVFSQKLKNLNDPVILAADTLVCLNDKTLGKPENENRAYEFLNALSGQVHQVKTAIVLIELSSKKEFFHIESTDVHFKKLDSQQIKDYILTKEPMDKAGAYAIQGLGRQFIDKFDGDYNNVVGLPLHALENIFKMNEWTFKKN